MKILIDFFNKSWDFQDYLNSVYMSGAKILIDICKI